MNKSELAYQKILVWGKIAPDINSNYIFIKDSVVPKNLLKNYISAKFG
jgi:hypothetical protein